MMNERESEQLQDVLWRFGKCGYAGAAPEEGLEIERRVEKTANGETVITCQFEWYGHCWRMVDRYHGDRLFGGYEVVFRDDVAVWCMSYYGWGETDTDTELIFGLLRKALAEVPREAPFRGPYFLIGKKEFDNWCYVNTLNGSVRRFAGEENIGYRAADSDEYHIEHTCRYQGGLLDQETEPAAA